MPAIGDDFRQQKPTVGFDTGRDLPSRPHGPQIVGQDDEMLSDLARQHDLAQARLDAHRDELEEQTAFHEREMQRARRVLAACESAMRELQPQDTDQATAVPRGFAHP